MNNDKIFVKAYTKTDGTEVSAHWRNKGPHTDYIPQHENDSRTQNLTLDGGVSTTDIDLSGLGSSLGGALGQVFGTIGTIAGVTINVGMKVAEVAVDIYGKLKDSGVLDLNDINKIKNSISQIESTQRKYIENKNQLIEKIVNTKSQTEYSNLHDTLQKQNYLINKNNQIINEIKLAEQQQNYEKIADKLTEFNQEQQRVLNEIYQPMNDLSQKPIQPINFYKNNIINSNKNLNNNYVNTTNNPTIASHALEFAKLSANKLQKNTNYLTQNGTIIYSTSELPTEISKAVNTKLYNQIGRKNILGVLFKYNSTVSTKIKNSTAINKFVSENIDAIVKNKVIEKSSIEFTRNEDPDLFGAIHYADVLFTTVDQNGNLKILIMDTYDFNLGENPIIDAAHYYQKYGFADPYYVLILLNLKPEEWKKVKL